MSLILRDITNLDSKLLSSPYISYSPITVCTDRLERRHNRMKSKRKITAKRWSVFYLFAS